MPTTNFVFCPLFLVKYDGNELTEKVKSRSVIQCDVWNQGCFDVAFFFGTTLVTIKVTTAKSHLFRLKFVTDLRNALLSNGVTVNDLVYVVIVPDSNLEGFKLKQADGTLQSSRMSPELEYCIKVVSSGRLKTASVPVGSSSICNLDETDVDGVVTCGMERL